MTDQLALDGMATRHTARTVGFAYEEHLAAFLDELVRSYGFDCVEAALGRIKIGMSGPVPQIGERTDDRRTSKGRRSGDVRRFAGKSYAGRLLARFANASQGLTDGEATDLVMHLASPTVSQWEGCRRRCSDLREAGFIADSGAVRGEPSRIVWTVTLEGRKAFQRIVDSGWSR